MKTIVNSESMSEFGRKVLEVIANEQKDFSMDEIAEKAGLEGNFEKYSRLPCEIAKLSENALVKYDIYKILSGKPTIRATEKGKFE